MTLSDRLAEWDAVAAKADRAALHDNGGWFCPEEAVSPQDTLIALASPARFRALLDVARAAANYSKTEADWAQAIIEARADVDAVAVQNIAAVDELDDALVRLGEVADE